MIIYEKRKPVSFQDGNCIGVTGENLAHTQEFLIKGVRDITASYAIHLRFPDGSVNSVLPDSTLINSDGTLLVWKVKKTDIFMHGCFELQIESTNPDGVIFQTEIVTLYADESLAVEDGEFANPNSEALQLREEAYDLLTQISKQKTAIESNYQLINQTDLSIKENAANKVNDITQITNKKQNFPSISYLEDYFYPADEVYTMDDIDEKLDQKADSGTTLADYGITDAYTKSQINLHLNNKVDKSGFDTVPSLNSPALMKSGAIYNAMLTKYDASNVETGSGLLSCIDEDAAPYIKSAGFEYVRIGKLVTLVARIVFNAGNTPSGGYMRFSGIPYKSNTISTGIRLKTQSDKNIDFVARILGTWLTITPNGVARQQDETLQFSIQYKAE